ncbi:hypothetical protein GCM10022223_66620 [Kineosporia mesophila]|uniref:Uncharacterized protein n=1 Tax=Kineosporia mesophila TaxID=566012 RepID=A0ABP7ARY1_9ACTN
MRAGRQLGVDLLGSHHPLGVGHAQHPECGHTVLHVGRRSPRLPLQQQDDLRGPLEAMPDAGTFTVGTGAGLSSDIEVVVRAGSGDEGT